MNPKLLVCVFAAQTIFTLFFLTDSVVSILDVRERPINWQLKELLDIAAASGLLLGTVFGFLAIRQALAKSRAAEEGFKAASGAFSELMEQRFISWGLSPAERDIAMLLVKGLSIREIAAIRETSEGTIKSQSNALYRKAKVTGRGQLQSTFVEDLMEGVITPSNEAQSAD